MSKAAKQAGSGLSPRSGTPPPKEYQFGGPKANPRHNGAWKKEDTARYKLEQMLKLSETEIEILANDPDAPLFERKLAVCIKDGKWKEVEGMLNQVYGFPAQEVKQTNIQLHSILPKKEKKHDEKSN